MDKLRKFVRLSKENGFSLETILWLLEKSGQSEKVLVKVKELWLEPNKSIRGVENEKSRD